MKLKFLEACQLEVVDWYDEKNDEVHTSDELFKVGEEVTADIVSVNEVCKTAEIQFGNGSVAYGVPQSVFEVVEL